ncbi:MAG: glycosyltransferase family 4 protein [Planctomycetota bacterium]|nr:glycosyltransferase family 4 protein [Planctomycetota bacterium]
MNVWVITPFEPIPTEEDVRLMRAGMLCDRLHRRGHQVTWWTPDFEHYTKVHRTGLDTAIEVRNGYQVQLLKSFGYRSHVGPRRLLHNHLLGKRFARLARTRETTPDVIVCAWPAPDLCQAASRYGREHGIPVIIDIRDLWPDLWLGAFPKSARALVGLAITPYLGMARSSFNSSAALIGLTEEYLDWGLQKASLERRAKDTVLGLGYEVPEELSAEETNRALASLQQKGFTPDTRSTAVFAGNFGRTSDLETLVEAGRILDRMDECPVRIVLCGSGDTWHSIRDAARGLRSTTVLERLARLELVTLLQQADMGIAPFRDIENYQKNVPNKIYEYLAMKLALVSPVSGCIRRLIDEQSLGTTYEPEDAHGLAKALIDLATDRDRLQACSENAWSCFTGEMDADRIYETYCDLIEGVR